MRWKSLPEVKEIVHENVFLLFPKQVNGQWRWLEKASWVDHQSESGYWSSSFWLKEVDGKLMNDYDIEEEKR